jgi:hypothetical protein
MMKDTSRTTAGSFEAACRRGRRWRRGGKEQRATSDPINHQPTITRPINSRTDHQQRVAEISEDEEFDEEDQDNASEEDLVTVLTTIIQIYLFIMGTASRRHGSLAITWTSS